MQLNVSVEEDEKLRAYARELIAGQVRSILRQELGGIVNAELAKMRLTDPDASTLSQTIQERLRYLVDAEFAKISVTSYVRDSVAKLIRDQVTPSVDEIRSSVVNELVRQLGKK